MEFKCEKCDRPMILIAFRGEDQKKAVVECPICAIREVRDTQTGEKVED